MSSRGAEDHRGSHTAAGGRGVGRATPGSELPSGVKLKKSRRTGLLPSLWAAGLMPSKVSCLAELRDTSENVCDGIALLTPSWKWPACPLAAESIGNQCLFAGTAIQWWKWGHSTGDFQNTTPDGKKIAAGEHVQYDSNYKELKIWQHYIVKS